MATGGASNKAAAELKDHILGTIFGNCIGDTIGLLSEFMTKTTAVQVYGEHKDDLEFKHKIKDLHRDRWAVGDWTDDSDQMILVMLSLQDTSGVISVQDYAMKLWNWAARGFPALGDVAGMGIGATTSHVLRHPSFKTDPHEASEDIWTKTGSIVAPNGGVMRTSILGVYQFSNIDQVVKNTRAICRITHHDPRCQASCVAVTTAIAFMLQKQSRHLQSDGSYNIKTITEDSYQQAKECLRKTKNYKKYKKEMHRYMTATRVKDLTLDDKNAIGYTYKAMGAGFWALKQDSFRAALTSITLEGGDADSNGAVAGAMLGCKLGYASLPPSWRDGMKHTDWLNGHINRFLSSMVPELNSESG